MSDVIPIGGAVAADRVRAPRAEIIDALQRALDKAVAGEAQDIALAYIDLGPPDEPVSRCWYGRNYGSMARVAFATDQNKADVIERFAGAGEEP
jgi:hypothetical protein